MNNHISAVVMLALAIGASLTGNGAEGIVIGIYAAALRISAALKE